MYTPVSGKMANIESHIKSIVNFEREDGKVEPISSPRSLEACLRSGYDPDELMPRQEKPNVWLTAPNIWGIERTKLYFRQSNEGEFYSTAWFDTARLNKTRF